MYLNKGVMTININRLGLITTWDVFKSSYRNRITETRLINNNMGCI